jgi:hypothetical protein
VSVAVENKNVRRFSGQTKTFMRRGDSGNNVRYEFCPECGTTLRWDLDIVPNRQIFAGGTLDDPSWLEVIAEMYTDEALPWARLGCELSRPKAPDDAFRKAMLAKASSSR